MVSLALSLSYLILSFLSHDLIMKTADLFGYVRVGVECTDLDLSFGIPNKVVQCNWLNCILTRGFPKEKLFDFGFFL